MLKEEEWISINKFGLVIILLLYFCDIILVAKTLEYLHKKLKVIQIIYKNYQHTINIDKTKIMIIKSNNIVYPPTLYGYNPLEEVQS